MSVSTSDIRTLADLFQSTPGDRIAVILPETGIRITYDNLREQVMTMASTLAGLGIGPGDRVATVLPNGLPAIVSFLAASIAGTAAPLNPGYRQDEFSFFLEDTSAKVLLVSARWRAGCPKGRRRQGAGVFARDGCERVRADCGSAGWDGNAVARSR